MVARTLFLPPSIALLGRGVQEFSVPEKARPKGVQGAGAERTPAGRAQKSRSPRQLPHGDALARWVNLARGFVWAFYFWPLFNVLFNILLNNLFNILLKFELMMSARTK